LDDDDDDDDDDDEDEDEDEDEDDEEEDEDDVDGAWLNLVRTAPYYTQTQGKKATVGCCL